jgi:hypothetical protein
VVAAGSFNSSPNAIAHFGWIAPQGKCHSTVRGCDENLEKRSSRYAGRLGLSNEMILFSDKSGSLLRDDSLSPLLERKHKQALV